LDAILKSQFVISSPVRFSFTLVPKHLLATHEDLARKLTALEKKYDAQFKLVFDAIRQLMAPQQPPKKRRIGFKRDED
jgi:hypothetical protein